MFNTIPINDNVTEEEQKLLPETISVNKQQHHSSRFSQFNKLIPIGICLISSILMISIITFVTEPTKHIPYVYPAITEKLGWPDDEDYKYSRPPAIPNWNSIEVQALQLTRQNDDSTEQMLDWQSAFSEKWVVVTSINYPTDAIKKLSQMKEWKLVMVGDTKTPSDWSHPNCVFLSVEVQKRLLFQIHSLLPYKHYSRKNIGYLYAIQHGAKTIYETDDDNAFIAGIDPLSFKESSNSPTAYFLPGEEVTMQQFRRQNYIYTDIKTSKEIVDDQFTVNPYKYFGQDTLWPRGYASRVIGDASNLIPQPIKTRPLIQQGLANGDPDMDAIFRLTRSDRHKRIEITFTNKKPVSIPHGLLVPFNSQNTLFHYQALWGLMIPETTTFRVCDIWRGYFSQRLLWELKPESTLTFHSPSVLQLRNPHNYLLDFEDEIPLYLLGEKLIKFLISWQCDSGGQHHLGKRDCSQFFNKIVYLSIDMAENNFWKMKDAHLTVSYLTDLVRIGYDYKNLNRIDGGGFSQMNMTKAETTPYP